MTYHPMNLDAMEKAVREMKGNEKESSSSAIYDYLQTIADKQPGGVLPGGISVEQAAEEIIALTQVYTSMLEQKPTAEDLTTKLQSLCTEMKAEQAEDFLVSIRTVCTLLENPWEIAGSSNDEIAQMVEATAEKLRSRSPESCDEDFLDKLFKGITPDKAADALAGFTDDLLKEAQEANKEKFDDYVNLLNHQNYTDPDERLFFAAAAYGEAVREGTLPEDASPGMIALTSTAAYDIIMASVLSASGGMDEQMQKERNYTALNIIISLLIAGIVCFALTWITQGYIITPKVLTQAAESLGITPELFTQAAKYLGLNLKFDLITKYLSRSLSITVGTLTGFITYIASKESGKHIVDEKIRLSYSNLPKTVAAANDSETNKNAVLA